MIKILLLTDFSSGYSRSLLRGVVQFAKEYGPWAFYRMPLYYRELHGDEGVVEWAKEWGADAIIAQLTNVDVETLNQLNIPIIVQNYKDRHVAISNLTGDYFGTGIMAADFFLHRGHKNFAYYGYNDTVWMRERGDGFRSTIEANGYQVHFFDGKERKVNEKEREANEKWSFDEKEILDWLLSMPKPLALFACDDYHAIQITEVCKMYQIDVPGEIAVLGVDNDELLCNISNPPLSSIELDVQNGGYEAGKLLLHFIQKKIDQPLDIIVKPVRVVVRSSTGSFVVSDKRIGDILKYLDTHYSSTISVDEISRMYPYSRRSFERKFKTETGITVYKYIIQKRIDKYADLLVTTNISVVDAASMCGFVDYKNISRVFTEMKGITPIQYRRKYRIANNLYDNSDI